MYGTQIVQKGTVHKNEFQVLITIFLGRPVFFKTCTCCFRTVWDGVPGHSGTDPRLQRLRTHHTQTGGRQVTQRFVVLVCQYSIK